MTDPTQTSDTREQRRLALGVLAVLTLAAACHALLLHPPRFPLDDAYITLHNATALWAGHDSSFPGVPVLVGATSLVHLGLVAALGSVLPWVWASWVAMWLAIFLLAAGLCRLVALARMPWHLSVPLLLVGLLGADAFYQLLNGIETGLSMAAVTWVLVFQLDTQLRRSRWAPVLVGVLPFVRPELGLLGALLLIERALADAGTVSERARRLLLDGLLALGVAAPGLLAYQLSTGMPIPQTMSVKQHFFADGCHDVLTKLQIFGLGVWNLMQRLNLAMVGLPLLLIVASSARRIGLVFLLGFSAAYITAFPGAAHHNEYRYLYPLLPLCVVGLLGAFMHATPRYERIVRILIRAAGVGALLSVPRASFIYRHDIALTEQGLAPVADFVTRHVPANELLLVHDIGFISTAVPNPLIDAVGLKDPGAARLHAAITWPTCGEGRVRAISELALQRNAHYFVAFWYWDQVFGLSSGLRALGWTLEPLREDEVAYQLYRLTPPPKPR